MILALVGKWSRKRPWAEGPALPRRGPHLMRNPLGRDPTDSEADQKQPEKNLNNDGTPDKRTIRKNVTVAHGRLSNCTEVKKVNEVPLLGSRFIQWVRRLLY